MPLVKEILREFRETRLEFFVNTRRLGKGTVEGGRDREADRQTDTQLERHAGRHAEQLVLKCDCLMKWIWVAD